MIDLEGIGNTFYTRESFCSVSLKSKKAFCSDLVPFLNQLYIVLYIYIRSLTYNANRLQRRIKFLK